MAADEGIETIIATPHVLRGRWRNTSRPELEAIVADLQSRLGGAPRLVLGSEYYFAHDIDDVVRRGDAIIPLAGGRYILVEFASHSVPPLVREPLYRVQLEGWTPVIAHPERNVVFQAKPELLASLIAIGVRTQVTSGSITGEFGREAQSAALDWLRRGWVHTIATDAHNTHKRPPRFRAARARVAELAGESVAEALFVDNPRAILENRGLPYDPEPPESAPEARGLAARLRAWLGRR